MSLAAFTPSTLPYLVPSTQFPHGTKSRSCSQRNKSLREDYANDAADVTSSSSALGLLAGRKQLHGVYRNLNFFLPRKVPALEQGLKREEKFS